VSAARPRRAPAGDDPDGYACARAWAALTVAHAAVSARLGAALQRACGLRVNDFEVLLRLDGAGGDGVRLGELRDTARLSQPALSRLIDRLEGRGWLRRATDPGDRRGVLVAITPSGRETVRRAVPVHAATVREALLDRLSPAERDQLTAVLDRIAASQRRRAPLRCQAVAAGELAAQAVDVAEHPDLA
jgi:DNA-binding MarR family transcriptional regulator